MKRANWRMVAVAAMGAAWGAFAWGGTCPETVLDRQGDWEVVQADDGAVKTLFLEKSDGTARTPLARVEVPSATVTNVYWDEFAGWNAQSGKAVGGMVTNVETVAGEFTFRAFVNDGAVYWEDRADGVVRLWTVPCKAPETKTLLAASDAGDVWGTSAFGVEPWNRGAAWTEAGPEGETMAVFENGATTRLSGEAAVAVRKAVRKGVEEYETDHGYYYYWPTFEHDGWYGELQRQQTVVVPDGVTRIGMGLFYNCTNLASVTISDSVASIGDYAFYMCDGMTNVVIGNGVEEIGTCAFSRCSGLTCVTIPDRVASIGYKAFYNCTGLKYLTIPDSVTSIEYGAFSGCRGLTSVAIPDSVTSIGRYAFFGCSGLRSVTIGNGLASIGSQAFYNCGNLTSISVSAGNAQYSSVNGMLLTKDGTTLLQGVNGDVTIPESVTSIGRGAFYGCSGLTSVAIGAGVTNIESDAFSGCSGLTSFSVAARNPQYSSANGLLLTKDGTTLLKGVNGDVTIPESVTSIGSAFAGCSNLVSVAIGNGVTIIDWGAFRGCTALSNVTIGTGVANIESDAFSGCSGLTSFSVAARNPQYSSANGLLLTKDGTTLLKGVNGNVTIPECVTTIGEEAFSGCSGLTSVAIGNGATNIEWGAFRGCSNLASVAIGTGVANIERSAFSGCSGLTSFLVAAGNPHYSSANGLLLNKDGTTVLMGVNGDVTIPESVTSIGGSAFSGCSGLTNVAIGNSVTNIGDWAFSECRGLTSVTIPDGVTSIGSGAFSGCSGLTSVTIGNGVTSIGHSAFSYCRGLRSVAIGNSVTNIGDHAFYGCFGLTAVHIHDLAAWCGIASSSEGNPLSYAHHLYLNGEEITDLLIPNGVTSIGSAAFSGCSGLTNVVIGNGVTSIGRNAFSGCSGLARVSIPGSVTNIGGYTSMEWSETGLVSIEGGVFSKCSGLTRVTIGAGVQSIADGMFSDCSGLTNVTIPASVTSIGEGAFFRCTALRSVRIPDSVTNIERYAFSGCSGLCDTNTLPGGCLVDGWVVGWTNSFSGALDLKGIRGIADGAFSGCPGLMSVTIPDSVTSIGESAFYGCSGLTNVTIGKGVTSIGRYAFSGCNGLVAVHIHDLAAWCGIGFEDSDTNPLVFAHHLYLGGEEITDLIIPDGVTSIGRNAFSGCSGLTSVTIPDNVTSIGGYAFFCCNGLTSVTIGNSVTSIEDSAFSYCSGLTSVTIPDSVTNIGNSAFSHCSGLTSVTIPDSVTSIGNYAFSYCSGLTSVTIPDSVTSIGYGAFAYCNGLNELRVPKAWEGTDMLDEVWGWAGKPEGCEIIYYEPGESGEAVAVPDEWMDTYAAEILAANGGDYAAAAKAEAANRMPVWKCYLMGLSTTDPEAAFTVKSFSVEGGKVVVEWEPDLRGTEEERSYVVEGAETLGGAWGATNAASRFFRVRVGMP